MPNHLLAAALASSGKLPSGLLFALVPLLVLVVALDVYCLIDLARAKSVRNAPKIVWAIVILFAAIGISSSPASISPASSASTSALGPTALPSALTPYRATAPKLAIVSIRAGST